MISFFRFSKPIVDYTILKRCFALSNRNDLPFFCRNFPMKLNHEIAVPEVRLVYPPASKMPSTVVPIQEALKEAEKLNLDLVQWNETTKPPVCKLVVFKDMAKQEFEKAQIREQKEKKMKAIKEVRMTGRIEEHDLVTKINRIKDFLKHQNPVRVIIIGRLTIPRRVYKNYKKYLELMELPKSTHIEKMIESLKITQKLPDEKIAQIKAAVDEVTNVNRDIFSRIEKEVVEYGTFQGQVEVTDLTMTGVIIHKSVKSEDINKIIKVSVEDVVDKIVKEVESDEITEKNAKVGVIEPSSKEKKKSKKPKHRKTGEDHPIIPAKAEAE